MLFVLTKQQLLIALGELNDAESKGFTSSLAVFDQIVEHPVLKHRKSVFIDIWERASDSNEHLDWGRDQYVRYRKRVVDGKLAPL